MGVRGTYAKRLAFVYAASVVCLLLAAQRVGGVPIDDFLLFTLGGASNAADARVPALIFGALPLLVFCYLFSDFMRDDVGRAAVYLFTRSKKRSRWILKKMALLLMCSLVETVAVLVTLTAIHLILGNDESALSQLGQACGLFIPLIVLNSLYAVAALILVNLIALRFGALKAFLAFAFVHVLSLFACMAFPEGIRRAAAPIAPVSQGILAWHDVSGLVGASASSMMSEIVIPGFSLAYSCTYLVVLIAIEVLVGLAFIKRMDLM